MPRKPKAAEIIVGPTPEPDDNALLAALDESRRNEILKREKQIAMAKELGRYRYMVATDLHRLGDGKSKMDLEARPFQKQLLADDAMDRIVYGSAQFGKALPLDAMICVPSGWKRMGDVSVGDEVCVPAGGTAKVSGVFPQGSQTTYRITFIDGRTAEASGDHLWEVFSDSGGPRFKSGRVITTHNLKQRVESQKTKYRFRVRLCEPVYRPSATLPLDPYLLGTLLGDGELSRENFRFSTGDKELQEAVSSSLPCGMSLKKYDSDRKYDYRIVTGHGHGGNRMVGGAYFQHPMAEILRDLGLLNANCFTKFIPEQYMNASADQRLSLLQGLMDTDGEASTNASFTSSSERLASGVQDLIRSLGGIAFITPRRTFYSYKGERRQGQTSYRVNIRHRDAASLFRLDRKKSKVAPNYRQAKTLKLAVESVEYIGEKECQCIAVDHPDHLFIADNYVCTHNTEVIICEAVTCAGFGGLKVLWVISKKDKRDKFVADRLDPCLVQVPAYDALIKKAAARGARSDSTGLKHFGDGLINFVYATAEKEFTSYSADVAIIDEHQECDQDNLKMVEDRMAGSDYGFIMRVGHPTVRGTEENANLDWFYQNSDQRIWEVECNFCHKRFELDWWNHVVQETRNKGGGITNIKPRDEEWRPGGLDMRPVCDSCHSPIYRFGKSADWRAQNPGHPRHGFQLGNLYNPSPTCALSRLYERYLSCRHNPNDMREFVNKVLGKTWDMNAEKITEPMLASCAGGETSHVPVYRFVPVSRRDWADVLKREGAAA